MVDMNFNLINSVKDRLCEARKKVTYRQRGIIETKKSTKPKIFKTIAASLNIAENEVLESALFEKIVRDCRGKEIRRQNVRRIRKIGSDEWFSMPASIGNKFWGSIFTQASNEDAIEQGKKNIQKAGSESVDMPVADSDTILKDGKVELENNQPELKTKRNFKSKALINVAVASVLIFAGYKLIKRKDG